MSALRARALAAGLAAAVLAAGAAWRGIGSEAAPARQAGMDAEAVQAIAELPLAAARLKQRLASDPADAAGWALLARTHARLGNYSEAGTAFRQAVALDDSNASLLADYADTLAFLNNRSFAGEPQRLLDRALGVDPANPGALLLAGLAAFDRGDYARACMLWETLASVAGPASQLARQASQGIAEARKRAQKER